jgi:TfoX/Sxy family transcriptional regulator of competence genes
MSFDPGLVTRVQDVLEQLGERRVRQKGVFGGRGFLSGSATFVIVWENDLLVKVPPSEYQGLLEQPGITPFAPAGERPMSTWLVVDGEVVADDPELVEWVRRGLRAIRK